MGGRRSTECEAEWLALDDEGVGAAGVGDDALLLASVFFVVDHCVGLPLHDAETYGRQIHAGADFGSDVVEVVDFEHLGSRLLCSHARASGAGDLSAILVVLEVCQNSVLDSLLDREIRCDNGCGSASFLLGSRHDHLQVLVDRESDLS